MPGKKLLVADDSLTIQKVIRLALSNEGYEIQAVSDGNDAIQQIALFRPDVVLIDVSLPGKSAFEVKRAINEQGDLEEVRFVLMSSAFEKVDEPQAEEVRFHGRLTKPFDPAHLRQVLTDVLAQVAAKRMEKTSLLSRPMPDASDDDHESESVSPPPLPPFSSRYDREHEGPGESIEFGEKHDFAMPPLPPVREDSSADFWQSPMKPDDLPTVAAATPETLRDLWDKPESPDTGDAPDFNPPPPLPPGTEESDIKELTESTIKISGLDDFQWSVKEPTMQPPPAMLQHGDVKFDVEAPQTEIDPPFNPRVAESVPEASQIPVPPPMQTASVSSETMEDIIRREAQATLEKMAQKLLPELAERLIKQEIHRMLSEQV